MKKLIVILFLGSVFLSGCTTKWTKPGATEQEFYATRGECIRRATDHFPPILIPEQIGTGYTTPVTTSCNGFGYNVSCRTSGGVYHPPVVITVDENERRRSNDIESCFYEHGWVPEK